MQNARMHHGWLLAGRRGIGKMHFALDAAKELIGAPPSSDPYMHPDITILERAPRDSDEEKKQAAGKEFTKRRNITVDQIRRMQSSLTTRPTLGDKRVIIVDSSDDLEGGAANALLKSLEEPPIGTYFMLIAHNPARLLPTIRSRCRVLRFPAIPAEDMSDFLHSKMGVTDEDQCAILIRASAGSIGLMHEYLALNIVPLYKLLFQIMRSGDPDFEKRGALCEQYSAWAKPDRVRAVFDIARGMLIAEVEHAPQTQQAAIIESHAKLVELGARAPTFNFDPGLLLSEIGGLLAGVSPASERSYV